MIASLTVGNLLIPLQFACRRLYVARPFPWNWVAFFPVQLMFGVICAVAAILFLQLTNVDRESFPFLFTRIGYFIIVVAVVTNVVLFGVEEFQRRLRERNQQLKQTVEKGTIALQQQEELNATAAAQDTHGFARRSSDYAQNSVKHREHCCPHLKEARSNATRNASLAPRAIGQDTLAAREYCDDFAVLRANRAPCKARTATKAS